MISGLLLLVQLMLVSIAVQETVTSPASQSHSGLDRSEYLLQSLLKDYMDQEVRYDGRAKRAVALERLIDLDVLPDGRRKRGLGVKAPERLMKALQHEADARGGNFARRAHLTPNLPLDLDVLPDGRRKRDMPDWTRIIAMNTNYDGRRRKRSNYKKSLAVYSNLRPLIVPDIIHMGRRANSGFAAASKRFLDTVGGGHIQPLNGRRRKRLLDTLVRARPIYDGKRG